MVTRTRLLVLASVFTGVVVLATVVFFRPAEAILIGAELRVGIDPAYPPFAFYDAQGELAGADVLFGRQIAQSLGVPIRFVTLGFDGLYDALRTDQVDLVIAALVPNPARTQDVCYSAPYFNAGLVLVSADANVREMSSIGGKSVAVQFGSPAQAEAERWLRLIPAFDILPYELSSIALRVMQNERAHAALVDHVDALAFRAQFPDPPTTIAPITTLPYVIATRADRVPLCRAVTQEIQQIAYTDLLNSILERDM
jgi:ABC-type amino acid transport substrate-binding protein